MTNTVFHSSLLLTLIQFNSQSQVVVNPDNFMKVNKEKSELELNQEWKLGVHTVFLIIPRGLKCEEALMRHLIMLQII